MHRHKSILGQYGFTMMELLTVVLIIGILAAISFPNIVAAKKQLDMAQLDEFSRQIYLAAQNETVKMRASGELTSFYNEMKADHPDWKLSSLSKPIDYPGGDENWRQLYYIPSAEMITKNYLIQPSSALSDALDSGGCFILELNPETGDVYSAFYADRSFQYETITSLPSRSRIDREAVSIGYYSGSAGSLATVLPEKFSPVIEIENGEELIVKISCPGMLRIRSTQRDLLLNVTITGEKEGSSFTKSYQGGTSDMTITGDEAKVRLVLDSFDGVDFASVTNNRITPGDNITIQAEFTYQNENVRIEGSASAATNSLFASKDLTDKGVMDIGVNCVRHLNNLRERKCKTPITYPVLIRQQETIDFTRFSQKGLTFAPLVNPVLFNLPDKRDATYDGGNHQIKNFSIKSPDSPSHIALFEKIQFCTLKNIRLTDCTIADSGTYAGALAASANNSVIENCGVYLISKDEYNRHIDVSAKIATHQIKGNKVGGLIGEAKNSILTNCYSAVSVLGTDSDAIAGGLIGVVENSCQIINCYSSGDVIANPSATAGGLIGFIEYASLSGCYSTSNVNSIGEAPLKTAGGLIGNANASEISNSVSYGLVSGETGAASSCGGFTGPASSSKFTSCFYLSQAKYNDEFNDPAGVFPKLYQQLILPKESANHPDESEPYGDLLVNRTFPFPLLTYKDTDKVTDLTMVHHGDWPLELLLQTSLIYYEVYEDASVGYYAQTSLVTLENNDPAKTGATEEERGDINTWKIDTLKDQVCVEDGYAIMTPYKLDSFDYSLNRYEFQNDSLEKDSVRVVADKAAANDSTPLETNVSMVFFNTTEDGRELRYEIEHCNIFRLPFRLQMTVMTTTNDKKNVTRFYQQLTVTGHVNGNPSPVFENYTFYYCPDFAKTAINPALNKQDAICPPDPDFKYKDDGTLSDNPYVYIRSARQLNALGRTPYYWNASRYHSENTDRQLYFKQETDINFNTYTTSYCQTNIDFMETNPTVNKYYNRPIGRTKEQGKENEEKNFCYTYDGCGKKIINYRCETSNNRFTGLFGEIEHATLKNIIMTTEETDDGQNGGYIRSGFVDPASKGNLPGVGALVGLVYVDKNANAKNIQPVANVTNCSVSGYEVTYYGNATGAAVGGLAGFNFGYADSCTAVNKETGVQATGSTKATVRVGGLVGSLGGFGSIKNCYAGGVINLKTNGTYKSIGESYYGGLCGGYIYIYGFGYSDSNKPSISNSYSYCTLDLVNHFQNISNPGNLHCYPVTPNTFTNSNFKIEISSCFFLIDAIDQSIAISTIPNITGKNMSELSALELTGFGSSTPQNTHPWPEDIENLKDRPFPFPAVVRSVDTDGKPGDFIHYGSWSDLRKQETGAFLCYYEEYSDGTYGFAYLNDSNELEKDLDYENKKVIISTGYGILCDDKNFQYHYPQHNDNNITGVIRGTENMEGGIKLLQDEKRIAFPYKADYFCYPFDETFREKYIDVMGHWQPARCGKISYTREDGSTVEQNIYLNTKFAANIYSDDVTDINGLHEAEIRTTEQLQVLQENPTSFGSNWTFNQTHDIPAWSDTSHSSITGLISNNSGGYIYDGHDNQITGLSQPLFRINAGLVQNLHLVGAAISQESNTAAFALTNLGIFKQCSVTNSTISSSNGRAAGFVDVNYGSISQCSVDASITGAVAAAGFAAEAGGAKASITQCSVKGQVTSTAGSAAGFVSRNNGTLRQCHVNADIIGFSEGAGFLTYLDGGLTEQCFTYSNVTSKGNSSGFSGSANGGTIQECYANCAVSGVRSVGFVYNTTIMIKNCYASGSVEADEFASGFFGNPETISGTIECCYSLSQLRSGQKKFGFGTFNLKSIKNCYWVSNQSFNPDVPSDSSSTAACLSDFDKLNDHLDDLNNQVTGPASLWTRENNDHSHPSSPALGSVYPYPRLRSLDHYGDWPVPHV